jgi:hypothetical protein
MRTIAGYTKVTLYIEGGFMDNQYFNRQFLTTFGKEITALLVDLNLAGKNIVFDGMKPCVAGDGDNTAYAQVQRLPKHTYVIRFDWGLLTDWDENDLFFGLFALAHELRHMWQYETGKIKNDMWNGVINTWSLHYNDQPAELDAQLYAYDAYSRLFKTFKIDQEWRTITIDAARALERRLQCL